MKPTCLLPGLLILLFVSGCVDKQAPPPPSAEADDRRIENLPDSFDLGGIIIYNLFKDQIRANESSPIDSQRIVDRVYHRHRSLWEECYGMLFGTSNEPLFRTDSGMVAWNRRLFQENGIALDSLADVLMTERIDTLFDYHLRRFRELDYPMPTARISLAFTPYTGIGFGGCSNDQFVLELNNPDYELRYTLRAGIPHELFHLIDEELGPQPTAYRAIDLTINEGLACYFTYDYFQGAMPKHEAVEGMNKAEWAYFLKNERVIYERMQPYFNDTTGDNPLLDNNAYQTFPDAPKSLNYWLGFRIVESYLTTHPGVTIRELASLSYEEIFVNSGYDGVGVR